MSSTIGELALKIQGAIENVKDEERRLKTLIQEYRNITFSDEDMRNLVIRKWISEIEEVIK